MDSPWLLVEGYQGQQHGDIVETFPTYFSEYFALQGNFVRHFVLPNNFFY